LLKALSGSNIPVEHIGSTSVQGLCAKPIIDIMIGIQKFDDGFKLVDCIEKSRYEFKGECGIPGRHFFAKGNPRTHHIHIVETDSEFWNEHLLFRNYLREHEDDRKRYALLKRDLARKYPNNREMYTDSKTDFIQEVIVRAKNAIGSIVSNEKA
jgi:GrpB-like predicted nucleotidyltransferase (UPF0157 family)